MLFKEVESCLKSRKRIVPQHSSPILDKCRLYLWRCFKCCKPSQDVWYFIKAKKKLSKELDISYFIKNIRLLRNSLKFLTSQRERFLTRMHADKNVFYLREEEKPLLARKFSNMVLSRLNLGDSSEFNTDDHEGFIKKLSAGVSQQITKIEPREKWLLEGIHTINMRQH